MKRKISPKMLADFEAWLCADEKSGATVAKYLHDVRRFAAYAAGRPVDKTLTLAYKAELAQGYAAASANAMLAALNAFLRFMGWTDCTVRQLRVQKRAYCSEEKELTRAEYVRLVTAAAGRKNERLSLILQTLCATGIRVSELRCITVEAVRRGEAAVCCKNKTRTVFLVRALRKKLLSYIAKRGIAGGSVFVTRSGRPVGRTNVWREMKALCAEAGVLPDKVFPHNLRHLFARTFYAIEKDIAKLADLLGHASVNTTRIYMVSTGAEHRRKMENMRLIL